MNKNTRFRLPDIFDFCGLMSHQDFDVTPWIDRYSVHSPWYSWHPKLYGHDYNMKSLNRPLQVIKHRFLTNNEFLIIMISVFRHESIDVLSVWSDLDRIRMLSTKTLICKYWNNLKTLKSSIFDRLFFFRSKQNIHQATDITSISKPGLRYSWKCTRRPLWKNMGW